MKRLVSRIANSVNIRLSRFRRFYRTKRKKPEQGFILADGPLKVIDPKDVTIWRHSKKQWCNYGALVPGDWDLNVMEIESSIWFTSLYDHFVHHRPWRETSFYKRIIGWIKSGHTLWGCATPVQYDLRCDRLDVIFRNIMENGYRSQIMVGGLREYNRGLNDEIALATDRHGRWIMEDGRHRLAMVKILGIRKIPIIRTKIHPLSLKKNKKGGDRD